MEEEIADVKYKIVMIGDTSVGKTSIVNKVLDREDDNPSPTVGGSNSNLSRNIRGRIVQLNIWDTAGQDRYKSLVPMYVKDTSLAILVYDITNRETFENLPNWYDSIQERSPTTMKTMIVGNKIDKDDRKVSEEEAIRYQEEIHSIAYFETSAIRGDNIESLVSFIFSSDVLTPQAQASTLKIEKSHDQNKEEKKCC